MVDFDNLSEEFNMGSEFNTDSFERAAIDLERAVRNVKANDPDAILSDNIGKANAILDRLVDEINRTGMSPRLGEVAGQIISAINVAAGQLYTKDFNIGNLQLKAKMIQLKEKEIELKERILQRKQPGVVNQNLIVTDRETVLRLLKENSEKVKLLENVKNVEEKGEYDGNG